MKRSFRILFLFFLVFLMTGCVKLDGNMKIGKTKSITIDILLATDKSVVNYDYSDKMKELKKMGYTVEKYSIGKYEGLKLKYKIRNIDKVSINKKVNYSLNSMKDDIPTEVFKVKKSWFKNKYEANFTFYSTDIDLLSTNDEGKDSIEYLCDDGSVISIKNGENIKDGCHRAFNYEIENAKKKKPLSNEDLYKNINKDNSLTFTVKVGGKVISNNANKVDKDNLIWKLNEKGITKVNFSFSLYNYFHIFITIIIIVLVIIGILYGVRHLCIIKKKR